MTARPIAQPAGRVGFFPRAAIRVSLYSRQIEIEQFK